MISLTAIYYRTKLEHSKLGLLQSYQFSLLLHMHYTIFIYIEGPKKKKRKLNWIDKSQRKWNLNSLEFEARANQQSRHFQAQVIQTHEPNHETITFIRRHCLLHRTREREREQESKETQQKSTCSLFSFSVFLISKVQRESERWFRLRVLL